MFHNTHLYFASKLYKSDDNFLLVGSIIPDIAITKIIKWEGSLHGADRVKKFEGFINEKYPDFINLYQGILAHNILDDLTHKDYQNVGYAYQNTEKIVKLVIKYYELDEKEAKGIAHNYIESAVDILLLQNHPQVQEKLKKVFKEVDKEKLAEILSNFFKIEKKEFLSAQNQFFNTFSKYDFSKKDNWLLFWGDIGKALSLKQISANQRKKILEESLEIVKNTYQNFIDYSLQEGTKKVT